MSDTLDFVARHTPATAESIDGTLHVRLSTDGARALAPIAVRVVAPALVRDVLLALGDVRAADLKRAASDRSDYLAYLTKSGKKATKAVWDAQQRFLEARYAEAAGDETPLDPIVVADADGLSLELFSKDESAYASALLPAGAVIDGALPRGVSSLDLDAVALRAIARIRAYRSTRLELTAATDGAPRAMRVPYRLLRGLGQLQAASLLPAVRFTLAPVDLYNVLFALKRRKAKTSPRALRYELVPGEAPRIVLEPWETVIPTSGPRFGGARAAVVRTFGRDRLAALARLLPHADAVDVALLGPGLPAFYVVRMGAARVTLALSGWTDARFGGVQELDAAGRLEVPPERLDAVRAELAAGHKTLESLTVGRDALEVRAAVLTLLTRGEVAHDVATGLLRARAVVGPAIDPARLAHRDETEARAHRLLADPTQVQRTKAHALGAEGTAIEGKIDDRAARRSFKTSFTIDPEGRTVGASCTCPRFVRAGVREGPCEHMIALRIAHARAEREHEAARGTEAGRKLIRAETRTLIRRRAERAEIVRLSLDERSLTMRFGDHPDRLRMSRLRFATPDGARDEYFTRLTALDRDGFIDASAGT